MDDFKSSDIVKSYLDKFPETPTHTLSRTIYNDNKECFNSSEHVRSIIRYYRGANGNRLYNLLRDRKYVREYSKDLLNPFKLPESDEKEFEPFSLRSEDNKILVLSDIHCPYHNIQAVSTAIQYGLDCEVNTVLLNGDIWDFCQLSQFIKDPRSRHFLQEKEIAIEFLASLRSVFSNASFYFKQGNHEERLETYLKVKSPELYGDKTFELDQLLCFDDFDITYIKEKRTIKAGKLNILHGHELKGGLIPPVNPARGVFLRTGVQTLVGHFHRTSQHTDPNLDDDLISCWSTGCLSEIHPEWMPNNKWNHGAAIVYVEDNGDFNVDNFMINKSKVFRA
jgi:predicted phosphodiesterase